MTRATTGTAIETWFPLRITHFFGRLIRTALCFEIGLQVLAVAPDWIGKQAFDIEAKLADACEAEE